MGAQGPSIIHPDLGGRCTARVKSYILMPVVTVNQIKNTQQLEALGVDPGARP
jgi:hypothetical protein